MTKNKQYKMANHEMNVIWKKDKLQKYSKESIVSPNASGDAAAAELHCRLCGANDHLQLLTEDRLDQTLCLYFGVQVPPEGVICESCIKCMKITEGFSALVHASFDKVPVSGGTSHHSQISLSKTAGRTGLPNGPKDILSLLHTKLKAKREPRKKIAKTNSKMMLKKMNIACTVCGYKYPVILNIDSARSFVCSRCLKNRDTKKASGSGKADMRCQIELKGRNRLNSLPKKPQQIKLIHSAVKLKQKYQCSHCPKKYALPQNLATHMNVHERDNMRFVFSVCGCSMKSKESLDKHLRDHRAQSLRSCRELAHGRRPRPLRYDQ